MLAKLWCWLGWHATIEELEPDVNGRNVYKCPRCGKLSFAYHLRDGV